MLSRILARIILRQIWVLTYSNRAKYFMTDNMGRVMSVNPPAECLKSKQVGETLQTVLKPLLGNPHACLSRLRRMMVEQTHVSEIVLTEHGQRRLSAWRQNGQRILWRIEEISQDVAEQAYPATIPALTVSESGTISHMNAVARALLGTRVNRFSMLVNAGELTWNAPNTIATNRGKERYFLVRRKIRDNRSEVFFLPDDIEQTRTAYSEEFHALTVPMIKLNQRGVIVQANEYACHLLNIADKDRPALQDIMEGLGRSITDWIEDALQGRALKHPEFLRLHLSDKEVFVQVSLNKIENDPEASLIAILSDATELKTLEAQFVQSAEGQGTEFNLILPIFDGQRAEIAPVIEEPKIQSRTYGDGVILLVEDEAPVRTFASRALQLRGYQVIEAASAEEALDQLSDPNLKIDVFVTDIGMSGRDGPSWVKEAVEQSPNTRVVFVSGYAEDVLETQQAAIPNSVFLPKPFSLDDLTETVQQQFH